MNCWLLCLPRSGSTFLCDLLNKTNVFPIYYDARLKENLGPIQKNRAFNEWLRIFSNYNDLCKNPPLCCKAIYHQYIEVMGGIPKEKRRCPSKFYLPIDKKKENFVRENFKLDKIQSLFGSFNIVNLKRDIFEQTVSTYFARQTNIYHIYNKKDANDYFRKSINVCDEQLIKIYIEISNIHNAWDGMLCQNDCLKIYYEDLIKNPGATLFKILTFLKFDVDIKELEKTVELVNKEKRIYRMTRPGSDELVKRLKNLVKTKEILNQKIFL